MNVDNESFESWASAAWEGLKKLAYEYWDDLVRAERSGTFPAQIYRKMGELGWVGMVTPHEYGGAGRGVREYCLISEAVGRYGLVSPQTSVQGQLWLLDWGSTQQKSELLPGLATGELIFSESISEPGVGSALKSTTATAVRDGDGWILNGRKTHVNLGAESQITAFFAVADEGLTAFLVPMDLEGVQTCHTDPIGLRLIPTADVELVDVRVAGSAVLGPVGGGLKTFLATFNVSRLGNASELIGLARRALVEAVDYAADRRVGDNFVTDFQGLQWEMTACYQAITSATLLRDHAAHLIASGADPALATSMAKLAAIDAAESAAKAAFALVGGYGLYHDQPFWRVLADVKVLRTAGGSREVLRNFVAKQVLRSPDVGGLR